MTLMRTMVSVCAVALACAPLAAATVDFDGGATDFTSNFAEVNGSAYSWGADVGINGSGGVNGGTNPDVTAVYTPESFSMANDGDIVEVSAFWKQVNDGTLGDKRQVGLTDSASSDLRLNGSYLGIRVINDGGSGQLWAVYRNASTNAVAAVTGWDAGGVLDGVTFTDGNWYKVTMTLTNNADDTLTQAVSVDEYDATGALLNAGILSATRGWDSLDIDGDDSLYGAFRMAANADAGAVDNFAISAIPEPTTMGLLALGGIAMLRRRRR